MLVTKGPKEILNMKLYIFTYGCLCDEPNTFPYGLTVNAERNEQANKLYWTTCHIAVNETCLFKYTLSSLGFEKGQHDCFHAYGEKIHSTYVFFILKT